MIIGNVQPGSLFAIAQSAAMTNGRAGLAGPAAITATMHAATMHAGRLGPDESAVKKSEP